MNSGMHFDDSHSAGSHLTGEQLAAFVVEETPEFAAHTRSCAECAAKADALRAQLADFSSFVRANAERSNTFWWRQRGASIAPASSFTRWAMAAAAVVIAAAASVPFIQHTFVQHTGQPAQVVVQPAPVQQVSDEALLGEVESDVLREYPDALAPVRTNAETELVAATQSKAHKKEYKKK
jgi:hypothetical protein